jgi:hypothetical protein
MPYMESKSPHRTEKHDEAQLEGLRNLAARLDEKIEDQRRQFLCGALDEGDAECSISGLEDTRGLWINR